MRISWRELDWISERDRHEIERRMEMLSGESGLLERVDFSGRAPSTSGAFEIRITANAAKRQIIAVRRDSQRARAFNSAFEALERSVASVLSAHETPPRSAAPRSSARSGPSRVRPALPVADAEPLAWLRSWLRRGVAPALWSAALLTPFALIALWLQHDTRALVPSDRDEAAMFSAVAKIPGDLRQDAEPAFSAIARLSTRER